MANDDASSPQSPSQGTAPGSALPPLPDPSTVGQVPPRADLSWSTLKDASKTIDGKSFAHLHEMPCARQTYMTGIATGFAFGGVKLVLRAPVWNACSWAVGTCFFAATVVWETCRWRRGREQDGMIRAMQIMEYKRLEKEKRMEERKEQLRVEEEKRRIDAAKGWWKPW
ncbi:hypothetical protein H072_1404 [Dactylellina haptotyla CBS 200.50]|uniref:Cytochrome c oxidase assembly protein COX20, mitochondrial n=1 Tax=Dactylellina haptotyla (strain CBS 200.50) TaxID=1284197 RepID=S8CA80_DACHA|nr:hypothetical protein H072_1404 [Dactylellina haptotyla CBS 200.50]